MPNIDIAPLTNEDFNSVVETLTIWAESHPK